MDNLELRSAYWDDPESKRAFLTFLSDIHNLDLGLWDRAGYWDKNYIPFSLFREGKIISSVCLYLLDACVLGMPRKLIQISGVGTLESFRRQGLNRELTQGALERFQNETGGIFLFADEEAIPFYQRCGFIRSLERAEYAVVEPVTPRIGLIKLSPDDPRELRRIESYVRKRDFVSNRLGINNFNLFMFHVLYTMRDKIYEIPALGCLVLMERNGSHLHIFDVVAEHMPDFPTIYEFLSQADDRQVRFHFHTDKLLVEDIQIKTTGDNNAFVDIDFPLEDPAFPFTSHA